MFEAAGDWGLVAEGTNPCRGVTQYHRRRRERFLTEAEFERLGCALDALEAEGGASACAAAAVKLLMLTGCRKSEVLSLRWEDVALEEAELRLADSKTGARLSGLDHAWRKVRKRAGLEDVWVHDLRHSYASRALALGENLTMIGKLLGHFHIQTTARYAHLARDTVREAAERIARSIAEDLLDGR